MIKKIIIAAICILLIPIYSFAGPTSTSGITEQVIIDRVRNDLNATSPSGVTDSAYPDSDFIQWSDEAVRYIVNKTHCLEAGVSNVSVVANQWRYPISGSYLDIETVEYDTGNTTDPRKPMVYALDRVQKVDIGHNKETGNPKVFCIWNDYLEIWPIPLSDQSGNTLYVYKINMPSGVSTTSSPIETPEALDHAIPYYVKAKALYKYGRTAEGDKCFGLFDALVNQYIINVLKRKPAGQ